MVFKGNGGFSIKKDMTERDKAIFKEDS